MAKQKNSNHTGLVYSTDPGYLNQVKEASHETTDLPKGKQLLRVKLDTRQRAGKVVTLVEGFSGTPEDLEALSKQLKIKCGTGGSVKNGVIIIQGDYKEKVVGWLRNWGYVLVK